MKTDDLLRKLEPLLPARVRHWRAVLEGADETIRRLVERQIALVARERLGDPPPLLLSLPPRERARAELGLGIVRYECPKWPMGISKQELLQNLAIFGRSGAGKTNLLFHLLQQLAEQHVAFVFLDWKRTGRHLIPLMRRRVHLYTPGRSLSPFPFNPFIPPPELEPRTYSTHVIEALATAYTLGDGAKSLIEKALRTCYTEGSTPTPEELLRRVQAVPSQERVRGWKITAIRALETLAGTGVITDKTTQEGMVAALLGQHAIVELDGLPPSTKRFLLPLLCLWLYYVRLSAPTREELSLVLVIEEAHHVLYSHRGQETTMEMLLRQCREIGISMIVVDQHPSLITRAALGNTYTSVCLNLKDPTDIQVAAKLSLLNAEDARHLSTLPAGRGVVKLQDRWHQPILVDFPHVPLDKGSVTDERLKAYLDEKTTLSAPARAGVPDTATLGRPRVADEAPFLEDITTHPDDGVDARYKRLRISADKGTRLKRRLLALGLIEEQTIHAGRTRKQVLRVTPRAQQEGNHRHESIAHEYWKRYYAHHYQQRGYDVTIEAPRPTGGNVDVLATRALESVAIEVETGKSNAVDNVRKDLLAGYHRVLVVATTQEAWVTVHRALATAGLHVPQVETVVGESATTRGRAA